MKFLSECGSIWPRFHWRGHVAWGERTASGLFGVYCHRQGKSPSGSTSTQAQGRSHATSSNLLFLTFMCSCSEKLWPVNHQGPLTSAWAEGAEAAGTSVPIGLEAGRVRTQPSVTNNAATHAGRTHKSHDIFWAIFLPGKIVLTSPFGKLLNLCFACQALLLSATGRTFTDNSWWWEMGHQGSKKQTVAQPQKLLVMAQIKVSKCSLMTRVKRSKERTCFSISVEVISCAFITLRTTRNLNITIINR